MWNVPKGDSSILQSRTESAIRGRCKTWAPGVSGWRYDRSVVSQGYPNANKTRDAGRRWELGMGTFIDGPGLADLSPMGGDGGRGRSSQTKKQKITRKNEPEYDKTDIVLKPIDEKCVYYAGR